MKCFETDKQIDLLLDGEIDSLGKQELKTHLAVCESCLAELEFRQKTQSWLKIQPSVLPASSFDNRMMQNFENALKIEQRKENNWLTTIFAIPKPVVFGALATFIFGLGSMFLLGRLSVTSHPHSNSLAVEKTTQQSKMLAKPTREKNEVTVTKIEEKNVTKYIKIPVTKEKIVTRNIYIKQTLNIPKKEEKEFLVKNDNQKENEEIAKQFNLKDLQPVANVTYRIIRKGETNEK